MGNRCPPATNREETGLSIQPTPELIWLKAAAEGRAPFRELPFFEALAEADMTEYRKLDATTKLALGYYLRAKERAASQAPHVATPPT